MPFATAEHVTTQLSHHVDEMEQLADSEYWTLAGGSPLALNNLLARLQRLQETIELAASR